MKKKYKEFKQGIFKPRNPDKCLNKKEISYRSHLEFRFMKMCDKNPIVLEWSSELVIIPYENPAKGKVCRYFVDAYVMFDTPDGNQKFLIEIKPKRQTEKPTPSKRKKKSTVLYENIMWEINKKKWEAAEQFAKNKGMIGEVWDYLKVRKKWWLLPIIILLVLVAILVIFGQSSALSPFIYALF